jgi:hypothetical protein
VASPDSRRAGTHKQNTECAGTVLFSLLWNRNEGGLGCREQIGDEMGLFYAAMFRSRSTVEVFFFLFFFFIGNQLLQTMSQFAESYNTICNVS